MDQEQTGDAKAAPKKSLGETLFTSTPVIMTVVATLLAGLSSSELTRALYFRSLASQQQSKVTDQWGFFQAKRIRGTTVEMRADLLRGQPLDPRDLAAAAGRWQEDLKRLQGETVELVQALAKVREALDPKALLLEQALTKLRTTTEQADKEGGKAAADLAALVQKPDTVDLLAVLNGKGFPGSVAKEPELTEQIKLASNAIKDRQDKTILAGLVLPIRASTLEEAIQQALNKETAFDRANEPLEKLVGELDKLVGREWDWTQALERGVRSARSAMEYVPLDKHPLTADLRTRLNQLDRQAGALYQELTELSNDLKAAKHRFTARRNRREAGNNQEVAYLYEIQVHQNSAYSDMHLGRSEKFFYGMLGAQLAVTISTLALAVKQRNLLWGLGTLAGLAAMSYGIYVYLAWKP